MLTEIDSAGMAASLDAVKAYLQIAGTQDDAMLTDLLTGATALCEQFVGQWLIVRTGRETIAADGTWRRLTATPVVAIDGVGAADGSVLPVDAYAIDIDAAGDGWVRAGAGGPIAVTYRAGMAATMDALPDALRQGIVRLAADHFLARGGDAAAPPAIVSALWRPWRRMRLT